MRIRVASCAALAIVLLRAPSPAAQAQGSLTGPDVIATFRQWTDAVVHHRAGNLDDAVRTIWDLRPEGRKIIADRLAPLVDVLNGKPPRFRLAGEGDIANKLAAQVTATLFLERAALLHGDAAILDQRPLGPAPPRPPGPLIIGPAGRPLPSRDPNVLVQTRDGEIVGTSLSNWNWPFARALLDRITPSPSNEPFVAVWYHATTAYMFRGARFGEAAPHLAQAAKVLPNDPRILFDRGCLSEAQAMGPAQQLAIDDRATQMFRGYNGGRMGGPESTRSALNLPTADEGNGHATDLFQRALAIDPDLVDARVRLARLLNITQHYAEADQQIRLVLTGRLDREVAFLAYLFGARAANGLGHADEAEAHVQAALKLYPHAGSAILAASETALLRADAPTALIRLAGLADASVDAEKQFDPWWNYPFGMGQIADRAISLLWRSVPPVVQKRPMASRFRLLRSRPIRRPSDPAPSSRPRES